MVPYFILMKKEKTQLHILLLQMRKDDETRQEELLEFVRYSGLGVHQFTQLDVFSTPSFDPNILDTYDALFMGGSSDDPDDRVNLDPAIYPFITDVERIFQYAADTGTPTFLSCMGFQIAGNCFGGEMIIDKEHMEMGTYPISLTEDGMHDPLFSHTPQSFVAVSGHKKRLNTLPPGFIKLASSDLCPIHAIKLVGKPFYGFQFHPEIDQKDLRARLLRYRHKSYFDDMSEEQFQKMCDAVEKTAEANTLVTHFVDQVLLA